MAKAQPGFASILQVFTDAHQDDLKLFLVLCGETTPQQKATPK